MQQPSTRTARAAYREHREGLAELFELFACGLEQGLPVQNAKANWADVGTLVYARQLVAQAMLALGAISEKEARNHGVEW